MIHLTYSNRTEALLDRLAAAIRAEREARTPWEPVHLVVPNPFLKEYVRIQLARRLGVAANLRFTYLDGLWQGLMPGGGCRLLSAELLRGGLLGILADEAWLAQDGLAPVRRYLAEDGRGLKAVQLASELALLFEEYTRSRPEWIPGWRTSAAPCSSAPELEAWQRSLWLEAVKRLDATGRRHLALGEALLDPAFGKGELPPAIHAFGLTHVAQVYHQAYLRLGQATELHLYALNPCGEFWEDLTSFGEALWKERRPTRDAARLGPWKEELEPEGESGGEGEGEDFYGLATEGPEALRRWGRPGRENIRLLNDVSQCDFDTCFEVPGETALLHRIQGDILRFQDPGPAPEGSLDGSVRFLACPSLRREAEVVATEIWRLMEGQLSSGKPLGFSDIAVVVPPSLEAAYAAHLQAAFQETRQIPWTRGDGAPPVLARTLEAAELLLELPLSGFTRAAMLRILAHPALRTVLGDTDPGTWTRWCQALGIVRGADREDWADTYLEGDSLNWDQGLKRLALGAFMAEGAELEASGDTYLALGVADGVSAGRFLALARTLLADARKLQRTRQDLRGWVASLEAYFALWLQGEEEPTVRALERIRKFLRRLLESAPEGLELPPMGFAAARHLALEALARLRGEQPSSLSRGVVVSCYAPMRAIPFRAVFLLGLGEGVFPGRDRRSSLDLRAKGRRPGDVSQTEKDKYLFLETLLSTRECLCCSFVARDELTGENLEPSGLFKEFQVLAAQYLAPEAREALLCRHPLRRFDPAYFPGWFPGPRTGLATYAPIAQAEARALWLGRDLRQGQALDLAGTLGDLGAPAPLKARLESWLGHPGSGRARDDKALLRLSLSDLRKWLECPLTGAGAVRLGLRGQDLEDRAAVEDEPFESPFLNTYGLLREVTLRTAREGLDCEAVYDAALKHLQAKGEAPFGVFAAGERRTNLKPVRAWLGLLGEDRPVTWRLGPSRSAQGQADQVRPALELRVKLGERTLKVELVGDLQPQLCGGSLFLESGKLPTRSGWAGVRKKALRAYLDHLALACLAEGPAEPLEHLAWFFFAGEEGRGGGAATFAFKPLGGLQAQEILAAWVQDLLEGDHAVLLPIEAVLDSFEDGGPTPGSIREYVDGQLEKGGENGGKFSTLYGAVPTPERYAPPLEPRLLVERRLGGFLEQVRTLETRGKS